LARSPCSGGEGSAAKEKAWRLASLTGANGCALLSLYLSNRATLLIVLLRARQLSSTLTVNAARRSVADRRATMPKTASQAHQQQNDQDGGAPRRSGSAPMSRIADRRLNLHTGRGERKYVSEAERDRALDAFERLDEDKALFALTLAWTGARVSEVLALSALSFQLDECRVAIRTLKRRRFVVREVPLPRDLVHRLDRHFALGDRQRDPEIAADRLWTFCRETAWRFIRGGMDEAGVVGVAGCPRGLRHGFAVGALQANIPMNVVQRWLGHARMSTTSIYADVSGQEEAEFAARYWRKGRRGRGWVRNWIEDLRQIWRRLLRWCQ
jgi:integrase